MRGPVNDGPAQQMRQHRESAICWACDAPVAHQSDQHRDGACPYHRRMVAEFWTGRKRKRAA